MIDGRGGVEAGGAIIEGTWSVDRQTGVTKWWCGNAGNSSEGSLRRVLYHVRRRRKGLLADSKHQGGESPRCDVVALRGSGEN